MATAAKRFPIWQLILTCVGSALFYPALMLGLAGDVRWPEGWIFGLWFDAMLLSNLLYLYFKDPALLAERSKLPGGDNEEPRDRNLLIGIYVVAIVWLVVMPLDARRFGWSPPFPLWLKIVGGAALAPALYFIYMATAENTYLSTRVRIQSERRQHVISTGVYGFVRHPLYLGCCCMIFGAPLLMGSCAGLLLGILAVPALVVRIIGEENLLMRELEGYAAYRQKVRFRLIPYIW